MKEDIFIAKLAKMYILHHPRCTAREISDYINENDFGIRKVPNAREISGIINHYNSVRVCRWFKVDTANRRGGKRYIINKE